MSADRVAQALAGIPAHEAIRAELAGEDAWVVGGAIRDALARRGVSDIDIALGGDPEAAARGVGKRLGVRPFKLSSDFGTWRLMSRDRNLTIDIARTRGAGIAEDLALRDFTINAIALPVGQAELLDPHGGEEDLAAGRLVVVGEHSFPDDPLRLMRGARLGAAFGLSPDRETVELARRTAPRAAEPAAERCYAELRYLIGGPDPIRGLELLDELAVTPVVLPEVDRLRGVEQSAYHHLDVYEHTIEVLRQALRLEREAPELLGGEAAAACRLLEGPLADDLTRRDGLRFAALLHDIGKPATRQVMPEGRVTFLGHDEVGAEDARDLCRRLRTSRRFAEYVECLTRNHLRVGFLVHQRPLSGRTVYDYLRATDPWPADATLLTVADRLATRGRSAEEAIAKHLDLASELLVAAARWESEGEPRSPVPGDELATELGIPLGPEVGELIEELQAAAFAGEIDGREQAIEHARSRLRGASR